MLGLQGCEGVHSFLRYQTSVAPTHVLAGPQLPHLCPTGQVDKPQVGFLVQGSADCCP